MSETEGNKKDFQTPYIPWEEDSDEYRFDLDKYGFPVFSDKNLRLVWAMIKYDSDYNSVKPETIERIFKTVLNGEAKNDKDTEEINIEEAIEQAVYLTDSVNSTHLATLRPADMDILKANQEKEESSNVFYGEDDSGSDKDKYRTDDESEGKNQPKLNGRFMTAWEIVNNIDDLARLIKGGDENAVFKIAHYSEKYAKEQLGIEIKKNNYSFATKFCHHACVKGLDRDLFCIFDAVVANILPYYIWVYAGRDAPDLDRYNRCRCKYNALNKFLNDCKEDRSVAGYRQFREYYDEVREGINAWRKSNGQTGLKVPEISEDGSITYQHIDKLIWYYFKGRSDKETARLKDIIK